MTRLKTKEQLKDECVQQIVAFFIGIPISGLLLVWYNHVWFQLNIRYWQFLVLAIPILLIPKKASQVIFGVLCCGAAVFQTATWLGLVKLPIL